MAVSVPQRRASWSAALESAVLRDGRCSLHDEPAYVLPLSQSWGTPCPEPAYVIPGCAFSAPPGLPDLPYFHHPLQVAASCDYFSGCVAIDFGWLAGAGAGSPAAVGKSRRPHSRRIQLHLATRLKELESEDAACVLAIRRMHKLGFKSVELLTEHYSRYGEVDKVLVSNAHERTEDSAFKVRLRPSGIGFVVMRRPEDAAAVLREGVVQDVKGVSIEVRKFEARSEAHAAKHLEATAEEDAKGDSATSDSEGMHTRCPSLDSSASASDVCSEECVRE